MSDRNRIPRWKMILATGAASLGIRSDGQQPPLVEPRVSFCAPVQPEAHALAAEIAIKAEALHDVIPAVTSDISNAKKIGIKHLWALRKGVQATLIPAYEQKNGASFFALRGDISKKYGISGVHELVIRCIEIEALQEKLNRLQSSDASETPPINYEALVREIAKKQLPPTSEEDIKSIAFLLRKVARYTAMSLPEITNNTEKDLSTHDISPVTPIGSFPIIITVKNPRHHQNQAEINKLDKPIARNR